MNEKRTIFMPLEPRPPLAPHRLRAVALPLHRPHFLQKKLHFYLLQAVIATTLMNWFQINSILIIVLLGCRLLDGGMPVVAVRTAFSDRRFQAFLVLFLLEACGLLHTHNLLMGWKHVESKATFVAIPFIVCSGAFTDGRGFRVLMWGYCRLLAALCCWCLAAAVVRFGHSREAGEFFYHAFTEALDANAVFFSAYVLMALLFLLSAGARGGKGRMGLLVFFTAVMVLLASKLLLALLVVLYGACWWRRRKAMPRRRWLGWAFVLVVGAGVLAFTDNPVVRRYKDIFMPGRSIGGQSVGHLYNGVSLRLFIWRAAGAVLNEQRAWVMGVSAGDSQDLLDQKYYRAGMNEGFLGYNFHNEYIEVLVSSGIVGLGVLAAAIAWLCRAQGRRATMEGWFAIAVLLLLACTESCLEMQQPAFLCCFFPLLPWWLLRRGSLFGL